MKDIISMFTTLWDQHIFFCIMVIVFLVFIIIGYLLRLYKHFKSSNALSLLSVITSIVLGALDSNKIIVFTLGIVFACINEILNAVVKLKDILEDLKKETMEIKNHISHNPVFKSKNSHKELVDNLPNICAKDNVLKFFEETFTQVETKGLINIDTSLVNYTNRLKDIAENAKQSIIGTYTTRPITTYNNRANTSFTAYNEVLSKISSRRKNKIEVIRVVVLSDNDICQIAEANKKPQCEVEGTHITETEWFEKHWSKNIKVLWTSEKKINEFFNKTYTNNFNDLIHLYAGQNISDFAVFDKKLYVTWREYDTISTRNLESNYGNMILNWNNRISSLCEKFDNAILQKEQVAFKTFEELVK